MKKLLLLLVINFVFGNLFSQKIHTPSEILALMVNSSVKYNLNSLGKIIHPKDYSDNVNTNYYYRTEDGKKISLHANDLDGKMKNNLEKAEYYFARGEYGDAIDFYEKAYEDDPTAHFTLTYIGQCYLLKEDYENAAKYEKMAIKKNYIDYMAHWFLADVYVVKGKLKEAAREITIANVLNKNNPRILQAVKRIYTFAGIKWNDFQFTPQIRLERILGDSVSVSFDSTWMMYSLVKAVWAFENGYKESMGVNKDDYSILEETEALGCMYIGFKNSGRDVSDIPALSVLEKAIENQILEDYILYEIMFLKYPILAYNLPKEKIDKIADYVLKTRSD
jgi:tetratricopeptide (TPR) repeat protein